jgi:hypothetical protein
MPGMDGRVLAEQLSARQSGLKSLIAGQGVLYPAINLLHKPFTEDVLIQKVREVLDSGKTRESVTIDVARHA